MAIVRRYRGPLYLEAAPSISTGSGTRPDLSGSALVVDRRALHLEDLVHVRVQMPGEATHRTQPMHVQPPARWIVDVVTHVQVDDLPDDEIARQIADRDDLNEAALHVDRRGGDARGSHLHARR